MLQRLTTGIKRFWNRSIRRQLMLGIALVHAVLMTIFVYDLVQRQQEFLLAQSVEQTLSLAESLAANSTSWLLSNDVAGLEEIIQSQSGYPGLLYAMVLNPRGRVLGHSDHKRIGSYVTDTVSRRLIGAPAKPQVLVDHGELIDIAVPVMAGSHLIGWARVGLDQSRILHGLSLITRDGVLYTLLAIFVGTLFAFFMARGLTRGLQRIVAVADQVRRGGRRERATLERPDELGRLAQDFNLMLDALEHNEQELRDAQAHLAAREERYNLAMRGSNDGLWDWDLVAQRAYFSPRWKSMLGYGDEEIGDRLEEWSSRVHPADLAAAEADVQRHLDGETQLYENTHRMRHKDGHYVWILDRGICVRDADGCPVRVVGTHTDITARKQVEDALFEEKERALVTLHSIGDAVITTDEQGLINFLNPVAEQLTGWRDSEARGRHIDEVIRIIHEESLEAVENPIRTCLRKGHIVDLSHSMVLIGRDDRELAIEDSAAPIRDREGRLIGAVMVFHDVSQTRELARNLHWQATHDSLTGLTNRREFEQDLQTLIDNARAENKDHACLYLDLDQFKLVNDTCGHGAGDELLRQLATLLHGRVRESDTLARLGGDEFGVLLSGCDMQHAIAVAESLRQAVREFRFSWEDKGFAVAVSIGIVPIAADSGDAVAVMSAADVACYAAKDHGRNRVHVYQPDDAELLRRHGEMQWVSRINHALNEDRFVLYTQRVQPVADAEAPCHVEILIRMLDEQGEVVPPDTFIPAAERYNLMPAIDRWVLRHTLAYMAERPEQLPRVFINLSGNTFSDDEFLHFIHQQLEAHGVAPERLCFEITETAAITNLSKASHFIHELKRQGCRFALDDFGSGLSSFTYLKNLPVDFLKIDGSFVKDMEHDATDRAMVRAIHQVGNTMGIRTIAEFVETDGILQLLREIGVDYAQGFGIERPRPLEDA